MILTFQEIIDFLAIWLVTSFVFLPSDYKKLPREYLIKHFIFVGLASVLHELFHKLAGLMLGVPAVFHAFYLGLFIGVLLKIFFPSFVLLIPGYVTIYSNDPLIGLITAFAGPFANFLLFVIFKYLSLKKNDWFFYEIAMINLWLFIFNMLPIPPLDGYKVLVNLLQLLFG